jgi:two-component system nitrogen regulation response regulator GlnG
MTRPDAPAVWVVDDDRSVRYVLAEALRDAGYRVHAFADADAAMAAIADAESPDLVFTDVRMPGTGGLDFLAALRKRTPELPVVVMSAYPAIATTAGAFRGGAHDYLAKPFDLDAAVALAARALPRDALPVSPPPPGPTTVAVAELYGDSAPMRELFRAIGRLAQAPLGVLITGETGTGKELVARALHRESPRASKPFVALNTAAIPAELLESELFGHEAGAFTGAQRRHVGRFEQADGGTLFLDEIGDMPAALQTRLLRVLAEGEFFRVGGRELIRVDVRVIAATHQDLAAKVADGSFRADLLHRLDVVRLQLPPLRARKADVTLLLARFLEQAAATLATPAKRLRPDALRMLEAHDWPGNVRELENLGWRLAALAPADSVDAATLAAIWARADAPPAHDWTAPLAQAVELALARNDTDVHATLRAAFDRTLLETAVAASGGHRQRAAQRLGLGRNTLTRKLGATRTRTKN